jgi:putative ABC transport system permease protein
VPQRVLTMSLNFNWSKYMNQPDKSRQLAERMLRKIQSQPGVLYAAFSSGFPMEPDNEMGWANKISVEGHPVPEGEHVPVAATRIAGTDYFKALGIPLMSGRTFQESDNHKAPAVVVINRSLARHYWKGEDATGKRVSFDGGEHWATVIGVVGDVKEFGLNKEAGDELYLAQLQEPMISSVVVRTSKDGMTLANDLRRAILEEDPQTAIPNVETLEQARFDSMASPRVMTDLLGIFAVLALAIAACGIGGILALMVSQRVNEIGIRMALGAKPGDVLAMILRQGMGLVTVGLVIGIGCALALTGMMKSLLFQIEPNDPITFVGVSAVLAAAALMACYVPARRALRIDPLRALRSE